MAVELHNRNYTGELILRLKLQSLLIHSTEDLIMFSKILTTGKPMSDQLGYNLTAALWIIIPPSDNAKHFFPVCYQQR
jgi:hypothetical protein